jgi:competence protein ComGF
MNKRYYIFIFRDQLRFEVEVIEEYNAQARFNELQMKFGGPVLSIGPVHNETVSDILDELNRDTVVSLNDNH